jgi:predicted alpha/beta-fold hydrolase
MLGIATKAWRMGFNIVRLNQRCCGGTEHLTPTLYNSSMSGDLRAVLGELADKDGLPALWAVGYSMGGQLVLKMAGEVGYDLPALKGAIAVCPNIDPGVCVAALEQRSNWAYERHFLTRVKARLRRKATLFPGQFDTAPLDHIQSLRAFDHAYTAPDGGYASAEDYYARSGARHVLHGIRVPTLILTAQDDPFIPYWMFELPVVRENPWIQLWASERGGHCGFIQTLDTIEDRYWAENRIVEALHSMPFVR